MSELTDFNSPFGSYKLQRYPQTSGSGRQQSLRAWDAADEYTLQWLHEHLDLEADKQQLAIFNDSFGALTLALNKYQPLNISDSYLAHEACRRNGAENDVITNNVKLLSSLDFSVPKIDTVIIKIPKTLALLEDQLYRLRPHISSSTKIVACAMAKNIHNSTLKLFEKIIGTTTTSLAKKKARLIFCTPESEKLNNDKQSPYPTRYSLENSDWTISNHANVFSRSQLDIGTRLFLEHMPSSTDKKEIVDLGCGNGLLGLRAAADNPQANITFCDESYMALASAKENFKQIFNNSERANFHAGNGLEILADKSANLILNNPPFHQGDVVGDFIAWQMFLDSKRVLKPGGELWVVGNRHMGYHAKLSKVFGNCETVASDRKFVILKSVQK